MTAPHETPEFQHSVEYTVELTFRVEGSARWQTAYRRAERIAERLANYATRAAHVVEVHATGGPSTEGEIVTRDRVRFSEANTGRGIYGDTSKLDRWIDPEFERALDSLARANAEARARRNADRERRQAVSCPNTYRMDHEAPRDCACVYCAPGRHLDSHTGLASGVQFLTPRCLCGAPTAGWHQRCSRHRDLELVVLDGDPPDLARFADLLAREPREPDRRPEQPPPGPPGHGGPELPPIDR
ncbi:MAG: hypothetical protein KY462_16310 [Actinobacteria bacterium]|nr:hypothetical protein [Actinomycetota bacterium]